jgi:hypothetical protein
MVAPRAPEWLTAPCGVPAASHRRETLQEVRYTLALGG